MAQLKSQQEYYQELMTAAGRGLDLTDGSAFSMLFHAVAQQAAVMNRNMRLTKLANHPVWCDVDSLMLMGQRLGMFQFAATSTVFRIRTGLEVALNVGDVVTEFSTKRSYQVTAVGWGVGEHRYELASQQTGAETAAIPSAWFGEFKFVTAYSQDVPYTGQVIEKLADGRDKEPPDRFRDRILGSYMTKPFNSTPQFYREILMQKCDGVGCVRVGVTRYLTATARLEVHVYLGDRDLNPVTDYTKRLAETILHESEPIGTTIIVEPVTRLDAQQRLTFTVRYTAPHDQILPEEAKASVIEMLQEELRRAAATTLPINKILVNVPVYKGLIAQMLTQFAGVDQLTATYTAGFDVTHHDDAFPVPVSEVPWVTKDTIQFVPNNNLPDNYVPEVV